MSSTHNRVQRGPVVVVGATVAGLAVALALRNRGRRVAVLDRRPKHPRGRWTALLDPTSLAFLERLGVLPALLERGHSIRKVTWFEATGRELTLTYQNVEAHTAHPYRLAIDEGALCQVLEEALPFGTVLWDRRVDFIEQDEGGVVLLLHDRTRLHGCCVVGADGPASRVRAQLNIDTRRLDRCDVFGVGWMASMEHPLPTDAGCCWVHEDDAWTLAVRAVHGYHLAFSLPRAQPHWHIRDDAWLRERLRPALGRLDTMKLDHRGAFTVHHRIATRFGAGRGYLVGEAAQVVLGADGSATNLALRDAEALARCLQLGTSEATEDFQKERARRRLEGAEKASKPTWSPSDGFPDFPGDPVGRMAWLLGTA